MTRRILYFIVFLYLYFYLMWHFLTSRFEILHFNIICKEKIVLHVDWTLHGGRAECLVVTLTEFKTRPIQFLRLVTHFITNWPVLAAKRLVQQYQSLFFEGSSWIWVTIYFSQCQHRRLSENFDKFDLTINDRSLDWLID